LSRIVNGVNKSTKETGEEKMKNLMILTLLLIFAVGCKTETIEEVPVKELTDEEIEKIF